MALDTGVGYDDIKKNVTASQKYKQVKTDIKKLEKKLKNNTCIFLFR